MNNHDYATPEEGTTDWHIPLNENFNKLDRDVEIRDLESARSEYEPKDGALFRATDTANVYLGDGSQWHLHNPPANESNSGNSNLTVVTGDTLSSIETALEGSNSVFLEPKTYTGSSTISIDTVDNKAVYAHGAAIDYTGSGRAIEIKPSSGFGAGLTWYGGQILGPGMNTSGSTGFALVDTFGNYISPSSISGFEYGIEIRNEESWSENNTIKDIMAFDECQSNIKFTGASQSGGEGTDSFRHTVIENIFGSVSGDYGIDIAEYAKPYNSSIKNIDMFMAADEAALFRLQGDLNGTVVSNLMIEGMNASGYVVEVGNYYNSPSELGNLSVIGEGELYNGYYESRGKSYMEPQDLTSRTGWNGEIAYHDGSGTPPASLCFFADDWWHNLRDGSTFQ